MVTHSLPSNAHRRRNAERNDAIERRRSKLRALLGRKRAAANDEDAKVAAVSPRARRRRKLIQPNHVDSAYVEHSSHMAGAERSVQYCEPALASCQNSCRAACQLCTT